MIRPGCVARAARPGPGRPPVRRSHDVERLGHLDGPAALEHRAPLGELDRLIAAHSDHAVWTARRIP